MNIKRILLVCIWAFALNAFSQDSAKITSINFIQEGETSKLIIGVDKETVAQLNQIKQDKQIILDLSNVKAEEKFFRGIDTSEFSGSIDYISPYKKPGSKNDLRFAIQLRDNVRSLLKTKNNKITVIIENRFGVFSQRKLNQEKKENAVALTEKDEKLLVPKSKEIVDILENLTQSGVKRYVGKKISINVNNVPYPEILKMIANTSGFNIIINEQVRQLQPLTLSLTNLPWDRVLDTVMDLGNLVAFRRGNILSITTENLAREDRKKSLEAEQANKTLEPLVTKIFPISYASLDELSEILKDYSTKERGTIQKDTRTRNLIVKDTIEIIERMKRIIETLDTQTPQVLIESKIVEANEGYEFRAGLGSKGLSFGYDPLTPTSDLDSNEGSFSFNSATDIATSDFLTAEISVFKRLKDLTFSLQLMESESKGKIISSPKVITENNQSATISSSEERSFRVTSVNNGVVANEIQKLQTTVSLDVTPKVTNEGAIALKVDISKSGFTGQETADNLPNIVSRAVSTNVLVDNGSTVVIGGLYQTEDSKVEAGIPFLKDLPLIGWLFKNAYNPKKSRNELIIFLTPRIINQEEAGLVNNELSNIGI